jgi:hypothetical protein
MAHKNSDNLRSLESLGGVGASVDGGHSGLQDARDFGNGQNLSCNQSVQETRQNGTARDGKSIGTRSGINHGLTSVLCGGVGQVRAEAAQFVQLGKIIGRARRQVQAGKAAA